MTTETNTKKLVMMTSTETAEVLRKVAVTSGLTPYAKSELSRVIWRLQDTYRTSINAAVELTDSIRRTVSLLTSGATPILHRANDLTDRLDNYRAACDAFVLVVGLVLNDADRDYLQGLI